MTYLLQGNTAFSLGSKKSIPCALHSRAVCRPSVQLRASRTAVVVHAQQKTRIVRGKCYVTKDVCVVVGQALFLPCSYCQLGSCYMLQNIDTDQIIPAEYLTLVPSKVL